MRKPKSMRKSIRLLTYLQKKHNITRRDFSQMLLEKVIQINGEVVESYQREVYEGDQMKILLKDNQEKPFTERINIFFHPPRLVLFNKPKGYVVSKSDPHNKTIYELMPDSRRDDFYYIGRLDKQSTGLLLLTNQPELVDRYESPENGIKKIYKVRIDKPLRSRDSKKAGRGIELDKDGNPPEEWETGEVLSFLSVRYERDSKGKCRVTVVLDEWKNRHIRRLLEHLWYKIFELKRIKVGKWKLGDIKPGKWKMESKLK